MNILQHINLNYFNPCAMGIHAGGPGSGCKGDRCGRPKGSGSEATRPKGLSDRAWRALSTHVPMTVERRGIAGKNEAKLARAIKAKHIGGNNHLDVILPGAKAAFEVKTIFPGAKNDKITVHPKSRRLKLKECRKLGLKPYMVAFDDRNGSMYIMKGIGAYRLGSMQKVANFRELLHYVNNG